MKASDAKAKRDLLKLSRKARVALKEEMLPGETPLVVVYGLGGSAIIGTERTAYVFKAGARAGVPFSYRLKPFEYESIMRVDVRRAGGVDVVVLHAPLKISVCASYWADERDDPWKARNAIPVAHLDPSVESGTAGLAALVARFHAEREHASKPEEQVEPGRPAPTVLEHLGELEQQRSVQPVVAAGPGRADCPSCGSALRAGWQFCPRCGAPAEDTRASGAARLSDVRRPAG